MTQQDVGEGLQGDDLGPEVVWTTASPGQAMKANAGKARMSLLPPAALYDIARVREFGAAKYADWDWTKSRNWTEYYDAVQRHLLAWLAGDDNDPESGLPHLSHAACTLMFLLEFARSGAGTDDRPAGQLMNPFSGPAK